VLPLVLPVLLKVLAWMARPRDLGSY